MTQEQIFNAKFMGTTVKYHGQEWYIHSTYDDDTADLRRIDEHGEVVSDNAPFTRLEAEA